MSRNDPTELAVFIKKVTTNAVLVTDGTPKDPGAWVPRQFVEESDDLEEGEHTSITIPEWLAKDKRLI